MKKIIGLVLVFMLIIGFFFTGCKKEEPVEEEKVVVEEEKPVVEEKPAEKMKVGMVTDAGTIDDKSFNQGTWEGVLMAAEDFDLDTKWTEDEIIFLKENYSNP